MTPMIVGIGGTTTPRSSTEQAIAFALSDVRSRGGRTQLFDGNLLSKLPHYAPGVVAVSETAREFLAAVRAADGLIVASPGYHGSVSGLVKNALDYIEETSKDDRAYLEGLPVGLIVTAYGWQAVGSTLGALRSIVHGLRGWPTPFGAGLKSIPGLFVDEICTDDDVARQLGTVGRQVIRFAQVRKSAGRVPESRSAD